jgi:SulP family sulfate permease
MLDRGTVGANVAAGIVVAMVAIPLNLALAVSCDLPPTAGLVSGGVAGLIAALLGGSRLNITGPEVALAPMTALIVATHGVDGMLIATAITGAIQIGLGLAGVGSLIRLLPRPVIGGFLAAVGVMVLDSQVPHLLGVHDGRRVIEVAGGFTDPAVHATSVAIGLVVIVVLLVLPRVAPRFPAPLVGLALAVAAVAWLSPPVERLRPLEGSAILFRIPDFTQVDLMALLPSAIALAVLASVDSLLCAVSIDARLGTYHRPNQELIAQGIANLACSVIGGMPVAAAIVRTSAAVEARGSTRLCGVVHAIVLLGVVIAFGPHLHLVPIAALAGVLLVVGARLIQVRELMAVARVRRGEGVVFVATAVGILATGFAEGILIGAALATLDLLRAQSAALRAHARREDDTVIVRLEGPLIFASQDRATRLIAGHGAGARSLVLELDGVTQWDASGVGALRAAIGPLRAAGVKVEVVPGSALEAVPALAHELGTVGTIRERRGRSPQSSHPGPLASTDTLAFDGAE